MTRTKLAMLVGLVAVMLGCIAGCTTASSAQEEASTNTSLAPKTYDIFPELSGKPLAIVSGEPELHMPTLATVRAIKEPSTPSWIVENKGVYSCTGASTQLIDGKTIAIGNHGYVSFTAIPDRDIAFVDFQDQNSKAVGVIVGKTEFARVPASMFEFDTSTLELSEKTFESIEDAVVCSYI